MTKSTFNERDTSDSSVTQNPVKEPKFFMFTDLVAPAAGPAAAGANEPVGIPEPAPIPAVIPPGFGHGLALKMDLDDARKHCHAVSALDSKRKASDPLNWNGTNHTAQKWIKEAQSYILAEVDRLGYFGNR